MNTFYFDTETYPIRPGLLAPKNVCLQYAYNDDAPKIVLAREAAAVFRQALESDALIVAHNLPFDAAVLAAHDESLIQPIYRMYGQKRARDTQLREVAKTIADGSFFTRPQGLFHVRYVGKELLRA
jgi:DNA polymerase I